jgi:hypothetical protein
MKSFGKGNAVALIRPNSVTTTFNIMAAVNR